MLPIGVSPAFLPSIQTSAQGMALMATDPSAAAPARAFLFLPLRRPSPTCGTPGARSRYRACAGPSQAAAALMAVVPTGARPRAPAFRTGTRSSPSRSRPAGRWPFPRRVGRTDVVRPACTTTRWRMRPPRPSMTSSWSPAANIRNRDRRGSARLAVEGHTRAGRPDLHVDRAGRDGRRKLHILRVRGSRLHGQRHRPRAGRRAERERRADPVQGSTRAASRRARGRRSRRWRPPAATRSTDALRRPRVHRRLRRPDVRRLRDCDEGAQHERERARASCVLAARVRTAALARTTRAAARPRQSTGPLMGGEGHRGAACVVPWMPSRKPFISARSFAVNASGSSARLRSAPVGWRDHFGRHRREHRTRSGLFTRRANGNRVQRWRRWREIAIHGASSRRSERSRRSVRLDSSRVGGMRRLRGVLVIAHQEGFERDRRGNVPAFFRQHVIESSLRVGRRLE